MFTIRKLFKFEAAHVLESAYSTECKCIHGHSYIVEVFISSESLNDDGMVIDFKKLKEIINPLIEKWDHALIVPNSIKAPGDNSVFVDFNPTAENMAKYLHSWVGIKVAVRLAKQGKFKIKVRVHETDTEWAEYES